MRAETGRCGRCGQAATRVWTSRDSNVPLELCDLHVEEHKNTYAKGWTEKTSA